MKNLKKAQTGIHYIKYQYKPFKTVRKNKERLGNYPKETWEINSQHGLVQNWEEKNSYTKHILKHLNPYVNYELNNIVNIKYWQYLMSSFWKYTEPHYMYFSI